MHRVCHDLPGDAVLLAHLAWDPQSPVDVDLQAVCVDKRGRITDAAYYNNMKACGGKAVVHSGDEAAGGHGREDVRVSLPHAPEALHMVFFLVFCFGGGYLRDVVQRRITIEQQKPTKHPLLEDAMSVACSGLLVAVLIRGPSGGWKLIGIGEQLPDTKHFMDCLDRLNGHIVAEIPTANRKQKVAFAMDKGGVLDFGSALERVVLGLGWDVDNGKVDLDASAVLFDSSGHVLEAIFFGNRCSRGPHSQRGAVEHSGDNQTGEGEGDDEQMTVHLSKLGDAVHDIFFCIHIYSKDRHGNARTFNSVANPYCRVLDAGAGSEELCRYTLTEAGDCSGVVIARLRRGADARWGFHALGAPSRGTMYKDSIPDMEQLSKLNPRALQGPPAPCTSEVRGALEGRPVPSTVEDVALQQQCQCALQ